MTTAAGVFGVMYDGYLSNAEDDPEGAVPVIIKTVKGERTSGAKLIGASSNLSLTPPQRTPQTLW